MEYQIVESYRKDLVEKEVTDLLNDGWEPLGGTGRSATSASFGSTAGGMRTVVSSPCDRALRMAVIFFL